MSSDGGPTDVLAPLNPFKNLNPTQTIRESTGIKLPEFDLIKKIGFNKNQKADVGGNLTPEQSQAQYRESITNDKTLDSAARDQLLAMVNDPKTFDPQKVSEFYAQAIDKNNPETMARIKKTKSAEIFKDTPGLETQSGKYSTFDSFLGGAKK